MSKLLLIIDSDDLNDDCQNCPVCFTYMGGIGCLTANEYIETEFIPDWCPLRPLPEKMLTRHDDGQGDYEMGWNACLDAILEEEEE